MCLRMANDLQMLSTRLRLLPVGVGQALASQSPSWLAGVTQAELIDLLTRARARAQEPAGGAPATVAGGGK